MKVFGKIFSLVLILLILVFSIFSVFGYSYYLGDNEKVIIKDAKDLKLSTDIDGGTKLTVKPADSEFTDEVFDIIEERIALLGLVDYKLYEQDSTGYIEIVIPEDVAGDYSAVELASYFCGMGYVTLRPGSEYQQMMVDSSNAPAFISPSGDTASTIVLSSDYITGSSVSKQKYDGETRYYVDIDLNDEGAFLLSEVTDPNLSTDTGSIYETTVSIWIDDRMIACPYVSDHMNDGTMSFTDGDMTKFKAELLSAIIESGPMPCSMELISVSDASSVSGNAPVKMIFLTAAVFAVLLAFALIYRYRLNGIIIMLCVMLQFALLMAMFTGFFGGKKAILINHASLCAAGLSLVLTAFCGILVAEKMRGKLMKGAVLESAVNSGFKSARTLILDITVVFALISLMGILMFGGSGFAVSLFGNTLCGGLYRFSTVMFFAILFNYVSGYVIFKILVCNLKNFKIFSKPMLFGGEKK